MSCAFHSVYAPLGRENRVAIRPQYAGKGLERCWPNSAPESERMVGKTKKKMMLVMHAGMRTSHNIIAADHEGPVVCKWSIS